MFRASSRASGALIAILAVAACNGSDTTAPPSPSIKIAVSAAELTVMCGTTGMTTATLTRGGDFSGEVDLSVSGLPNGVSAFLSPSELTGTVTSTTITMVAMESAPPGSYTITVLATSSIGEATATYKLVIVEEPHFHLALDPSVRTVGPGRMTWISVNIDRRGGFSGSVSLSAVSSTDGFTVNFEPAIVTGTTATAMIEVAGTVPDGNYTLTVVGEAFGIPTTAALIALTVRTPVTEWYLVADPSELTVVRGSTGRAEVWVVTDDLFPGWATYSLVNPPAGVHAEFEYHYGGGYEATATIFVPTTVAAGRYTLTFAVSFPGVVAKTVTIGLTVKDP